MTRCLRYIPFVLLAITAAAATGHAQNPGLSQTGVPSQNPGLAQTPETQKAIAAATGFMNALIRDSSIDNLLPLCSLPFCHDDSVIITTHAELQRSLNQLIAAAAKDRSRTHPRVDSAYVLNIRKGAMFGMVPMNIYFTVVQLRFTVRGQQASRLFILAVQLTDEAKVVGIEE
ncbi:MAG TPA: hypothetical protein VN616_08505 [Puia sp.]|nr:hypothetical protein [Puia sp.]